MVFPQPDRETSLDELFHPKKKHPKELMASGSGVGLYYNFRLYRHQRDKPNEGVPMGSIRGYDPYYGEEDEEPYVGRGVAKAEENASGLTKKAGTLAEDKEFDPGSNLMDALSVLHTSQADVLIALNTLEAALKPVLANVHFNEEPARAPVSPGRVAISLDRTSPALSSVVGAIDANDNLIAKIKDLVHHLTLG